LFAAFYFVKDKNPNYMKIFKINPEEEIKDRHAEEPEKVAWDTIRDYAILFFVCYVVTKDAYAHAGKFWLAIAGVTAIGAILYYLPMLRKWMERNKDL